jgi:hypothetical protein
MSYREDFSYDDLWKDEYFTPKKKQDKYVRHSPYVSHYEAYGNLASKNDASKSVALRHRDQYYNNIHFTAPLPRQQALNFIGKRIIPYRGMIDASTQNTDGFNKLNNSSQKISEADKLHTTPIKKNFLG